MNSILTIISVLLVLSIGLLVYTVLKLREANLKIAKQTLILNSVQKLSRKMYQLENREFFFTEMWSILKQITDANEFTYFKFDGIDALIPEFVEGIYKEQILKSRLKIGEGFSGKVALDKTPQYLNGANKSSIAKHVPGTPNEDSALLAAPVIFNSELYGVILLTKLGGKSFNKEELNITEIFVNMASSLIAGSRLVSTIKSGFIDMLKTLITAVELKDTYTAGHSLRVSRISEIIAKNMGLPKNEVTKCKIGGLLHDIGKIGISEEILKKDTPITQDLLTEIFRHPELGYRLIKKLKTLEGVSETVLYHHEWYNGRGYPKGLKDGQIPISSRIVHVADAIDAMVSGRPHSKKKTLDETFSELVDFSGTQFDPKVVQTVLNSKDEVKSVYAEEIKETILDDEELFEVL
ncbi:HD domain-containing phosphohydrolase [Caldisericum exile]|uniref:HD-GYP domain-containing protein n=1 Tax=Caldisericum exile (strain DSM 21853 / NBRC 104410 / AZM16c01) TaxID=511051 RepID=A0A7U6JFJ1_CALEA|nr:HD domain-containing phosphohydrolase [Caldisericum exile]BAL80494.1 hypothetical protein CSE_03680 [Caldisericum exile AZM16c01]